MANKIPVIVKCITISSSDDDDDRMPKIIDTVSLQGVQGQSLKKYDIFNLKIRKPIINPKPPASVPLPVPVPVSKPIPPKPNVNDIKRIKPVPVPHSVTKKSKPLIPFSVNDDSAELFKKFRIACQRLGTSSKNTAKICDKVVRAYTAANPEYISSENFKTLLKTSICGILNYCGTKPWHIVRSVVDELKHHKLNKKNKKIPLPEKWKVNSGDSPGEGTSKDVAGGSKEAGNEVGETAEEVNKEEDIEINDPKKRRLIKKLDNTLKKLDHRIRQLEEKEISLDDLDDEDSYYIKLDRYKTHFAKVYKKFCQLTKKPDDAERLFLRKVSFSGSAFPEINRCLEMFYNKNREFPDFQDVKKLVQNVNVTKKMKWPPIKVHDIAEKTFKEFGEMLKRLRQFDDYEVMTSYLSTRDDPAKQDSELRQKLQDNATLNKKREQEVIDSFVDKQMEHLDNIKISDISDSNREHSEQDTQSENEAENKYTMSPEILVNYDKPFKDDFKSDEEIIEDPKSNFTTYLQLKPKVGDCIIEENDTKDENGEIKGGCSNEVNKTEKNVVNLEDFKEQDKNNICIAEVEKNKTGACKRKISLLSSDESNEEEYESYQVMKKKKILNSNTDKTENLNVVIKDKLGEVNKREEKIGKSRIKIFKLLDEIISSDDSSKKRSIILSIDGSSDDEAGNNNTLEQDLKPKEQCNKDENKENCTQTNLKQLTEFSDNKDDINTLPIKPKLSQAYKKENVIKEKITDYEHKETLTPTLFKKVLSIDSFSDDNLSGTTIKRRIQLLSDEFSDESEDNQKDKSRKKKIKLSIDDSSESEMDNKPYRREKVYVLDESNKLDQEYVLPRKKVISLSKRIRKTRNKKKIVYRPIYKKYNIKKTTNVSSVRKHNKSTDSEQDDNFYKIVMPNLNRNNTIITNLSRNNMINCKQNPDSMDNKKLPINRHNHECVSPSIFSCNSSEKYDNDSEIEISDTLDRTFKVENNEVKAVNCSLKTNMKQTPSGIIDIKQNNVKVEDMKMELKLSESDVSSDEKETPMALEDSDYGVDEREDSDDGIASKFIIKRTLILGNESKNIDVEKKVKRTLILENESKNIDVEKKVNGKDIESDSSTKSKNGDQNDKSKQEDSDSSDLDESVVIISEDILDEKGPEKTNKFLTEEKPTKLPSDSSLQGSKYYSSFQKTKFNSINEDPGSDSDNELSEAVRLCEVNISDSEPEPLNIDDESSDLSDSNTKKPTLVVLPTKKRKEPTPDLCIIMESTASKNPVLSTLQGQRPRIPLMRQTALNFVPNMPIRKPNLNPLIRPPLNTVIRPSVRSVNAVPTIRPVRSVNAVPTIRSDRSLNPIFNRKTGFNPSASSTPVQLPQSRINNRNTLNKVMVNKITPPSQRCLFAAAPAKVSPSVRQSKIQVQQSFNNIRTNRKVTNGNIQMNTNRIINRQLAIRRPQNSKVVPAEEDIIVLD